MGSNPINLGFRFVLELATLLAAVLWGSFAVPGDPSRSGKAPVPVPGWIRLALELIFFALAVFVVYRGGNQAYASIFGVAVAAHYLLSYDRVIWLLQQIKK